MDDDTVLNVVGARLASHAREHVDLVPPRHEGRREAGEVRPDPAADGVWRVLTRENQDQQRRGQ
jgi:hypothetical protein